VIRHAWKRETTGLADRESHEQARAAKLYRTLGFKVYSLSQYRRANQTPGLPDLLCKHGPRHFSFTHELKTREGRVSKEQEEFRRLCEACGDMHVVGGYEAGVAFLQAHGFIAPEW
jgi:hypothetical protein